MKKKWNLKMREKVVKKNGDEGESKKRDTEAVGREGGKNGEHSREKGCSRKDTRNWPLIAPLPSYGRGRELPGGRYISFIHGDGVRGSENGTIDGQGDVWWNMWRQRALLIEFMNSNNIIISNNVVVRYVTILAPSDSPNTDGVDPEDLVALKSGWDEYGIAYGRPSFNITIRRIRRSSQFAGIAVGSKASGGVENVLADHINRYNMGVGINTKTNIGSGAFIRSITVSDMYIEKVRKGVKIALAGDVGDRRDEKCNQNALPIVKGITLKDIWCVQVQLAGLLLGQKNSPFTGICLCKINLHGVTGSRNALWLAGLHIW
ncbi:polygalacturonase [Pyrus ussuriensis x Pyrus communis]|uniref:Polygalacturonase n=1 Tax=Pyrus ussuriensis x Pyrus communis TaxID=2448454 RepID=A0A5N5G029_9ROSA|nr:polygalacturonase [Pyrus ussuriensis x Pyrus communis]